MDSGDSLSRWLSSDIFIVFVVLLLLLLLVIFTVCWLMRRHRTRSTEKMAEIEIIPVDSADLGNSARFTLKIVTEQTHATELVEMLTRRCHSVEVSDHHCNPSVSAVTEDEDNNQDYTDAQQNI